MTAQSTYAYRYGLVAANACGVISRYKTKRQLDEKDVPVIRRAEDLLTDVVHGGKLLEPGSHNLEATKDSVHAFGSALAAVVACGRDQDNKNLESLILWFDKIRVVLHKLGNPGEQGSFTDDDLEEARKYFECLAEQMVAQVNTPVPLPVVFE